MADRPYQIKGKAEISQVWQDGHRNVLYVLPTGGGKCLGKGTPVLMYDGSIKNVEDIQSGDLLMGPDSKSRTVLSTCIGSEMLYRVIPTKGDTYIVNESHILSLKQTGIKSKPLYPSQSGKGKVINISVLDYLASSKTFKHTHKGWRTRVIFSEVREFPTELPPYMLGLWLGDGSSKGAEITTADSEIVEYIKSYSDANGFNINVTHQPNNASKIYVVSSKYKRVGLRQQLRNNNLLHNKHIPHTYLTGSIEQRLELLAGIIDSDGFMSHNGYDLVFKVERLANDVVYLARSLGFAAYIKPCKKTCCNNGVTGDYFRISISGSPYKIPVKIPRYQNIERTQKKDVLVTGIRVEPIGVGDYYGFEIDGDRLFMLGDFTVTHNTKTFSGIIHAHLIAKMVGLNPGPSVAIAHRKELVTQISMALNRDKVPHRIIGPDALVRECVRIHMEDTGTTHMHPNAKCAVASVQTLDTPKSKRDLVEWGKTVTLWVQDEAHHVLADNMWGRATLLFPNAKGLGVSATPTRADGKGLGRHADGLFDTMVVGPSMRELIDMGYLVDYKIYAPPSDLDLTTVDISKATGDYVEGQVAKAVKKSSIMGDVVEHYIRIANGKRGITFVPDIEIAELMAERFRQAGVPAMAISSKNTAVERFHAVRDLASGKLLQLVNVDILGEGVDIPVVEVTSFARPTESYSLYVQQFGRVLRLFIDAWLSGNWETFTNEVRKQHIAESKKPHAIIIDHVGNVVRHGLPDAPRKWSLDRREKRAGKQKDPDVIPVRSCPECTAVYERIYRECPYCGFAPIPSGRSAPEQVDGDLAELDAETLARMRGEVAKVNMTMEEKAIELAQKRVPRYGQRVLLNKHHALLSTHKVLADQLAWWGGHRSAEGMSDSEIQRRFFFRFGIDVLSAQALGRKEAEELIELLAIDNYVSK